MKHQIKIFKACTVSLSIHNTYVIDFAKTFQTQSYSHKLKSYLLINQNSNQDRLKEKQQP